MEYTFLKKAKEMLEVRSKRTYLRQAVTAMMVLVAFSTSYLLMMPAITMGGETPTCGIEAHEHDDSCYETLLVCSEGSKPGHTHSDSCYSESYTCGQEEHAAHSHSDACWSITCGQKEGAGHSHSDACYGIACGQSESTGHSHSDACYGIACGQSESAGHSHSDACYTEICSLSCDQSESDGHSHDDSCYDTSFDLTCGQEESTGHSHSDACNGIACGQSESAGHSHSDACNGLACAEEEYEAHTHSDTCKSMTCGLSESAGHTHDDSCKTRSTEPGCGLEECEASESEHIHGTECYVTRLACSKTVHTHSEVCYAAEDAPDSNEDTEIILSDDILNRLVGLNVDLWEGSELPDGSDYSDSLVVDQTVTSGEDGIYTLTLEVYAKGEVDLTSTVHPKDLALLLDQSADLYVPALGETELDITGDDYVLSEDQLKEAAETCGMMNRASFLHLLDEAEFSENMALSMAQLRGFFLAQSAGTEESTGEWYIVQHLPEEGWLVETLADESESVIYENISEMAEELPAHIQRFYVSRLGQQIIDKTFELNGAAVLSAAIADYFQLFQADAEELEAPQIKVYTAEYLGADTFSEEWVEFTEARVELIASEEDEDRIQSVDISNFNFSGEILSEADELTGIAAGGSKLIVQLPVETREGFWGGNNVPVSSEDAGIYVGESIIKGFPVPEVNVEMTLGLESGTAAVFYGQTIGVDDLMCELTVGGAEVTVDSDENFIPQADWMDDYAKLTWVEKPGEICSTEDSDGHIITVNLSPLYNGENALGTPVGMGFVDSEEPPTEVPVAQEVGEESEGLFNLPKDTVQEETIVGVDATAEVSVRVLTPVITFRDIVISLGNQPNFSTPPHNPVKAIKWVSADEEISVEDGSNTPDLSFVYTPMMQEDVYLLDTPMNVAVLYDGTDITDVVTFAANVCDLNLHDVDESIDGHKHLTESGEDLPEFWIHVQSGFELPETGGIGTKIFYGLGGVLVAAAVVLLVTKKRMANNEDEDDL